MASPDNPKIQLVLTTDRDKSIWNNVERTSIRVKQWPAWKRVAWTEAVEEYGQR